MSLPEQLQKSMTENPAPVHAEISVLEIELSGLTMSAKQEEWQKIGVQKIILHADKTLDSQRVLEYARTLRQNGLQTELLIPADLRNEYDDPTGLRLFCRVGTDAEVEELCNDSKLCGIELIYTGADAVSDFVKAAQRCKAASLEVRFGCSDAFINASLEEIRKIADANERSPYPVGMNCMRAINSCFIAADGEVYPCQGCRISMGNMKETSLHEILQNSTVFSFYRNFREQLKKPCRDCAIFGQCVGCRGRAYHATGDFLAADPACPRSEKEHDKILSLPIRDPANYMPHKPPMLMVSTLHTVADNLCETDCTVAEDNPFLREDSTLHPSAFIEIGAQSLAFLDTFLHPGKHLNGMLVEVMRFENKKEKIKVGDTLFIICRKSYEMPPWSIGEFEIFRDHANGKPVAKGELKVCQFSAAEKP